MRGKGVECVCVTADFVASRLMLIGGEREWILCSVAEWRIPSFRRNANFCCGLQFVASPVMKPCASMETCRVSFGFFARFLCFAGF